MVRLFLKSFFVDVKAKYLLSETKMRGMETEWRSLGVVGDRHRDGFAGLGGYSAYQEAPEVISSGSRRHSTPSLLE